MRRLINLSVLIGTAFLFTLVNSCSSPTVVTSSWEKDNLQQEYDNLMVAALTSDATSQVTIEDELVDELEDEDGVSARKSVDVLSADIVESDNQKEEVFSNLKADGVDGILTISVLDAETEARYVPGGTVYNPVTAYGYYGTFWDYYDYWYPQFRAPGYYSLDKVYYMESNLYDAETEELVWSAQSETYNPIDLESFAENYSDEIVDELDDQDIID